MNGNCIAHCPSGDICGAPATIIDEQRGGLVCGMHAPISCLECGAPMQTPRGGMCDDCAWHMGDDDFVWFERKESPP